MDCTVSIIIPNFNRAHIIGETLDSIIRQSYTNWECIVIDDHSTDNSENIITNYCNKDKRIKYYKRPIERLKGQCSCRNFGFEKSSGKYVNWLDSDDIIDKHFILKKLDAFNQDPDLDCVISKTKYFSETINNIIFEETRTIKTNNIIEDFILQNVSWYVQDPMWKKDFLEDKLLYNENIFAGGVDREFHIRMLLKNPSIKIIDDYLTYCRKHTDNVSSKFYSGDKLMQKKHMEGSIQLIKTISEHGFLSENIMQFYFKRFMGYLPYIYDEDEDLHLLRNTLKKLTYLNKNIYINWVIFFLSLSSFKTFGKGEKILKLSKRF